jgi:hypothetical protein
MNRGSADTSNMGQPANLTVDPVSNEVYVADGYGNPDAPPTQQFRLPHNIAISRDGFVYVADRPNNRIQVFRKDGTYVNEVFVSKRTLLQGAASGFALSTDPQQRWLYMIDGANHHVWILERQSLRIVARFASKGCGAGHSTYRTRSRWTAAATSTWARTSTRAASSASSTRAWAGRGRAPSRRRRSSGEAGGGLKTRNYVLMGQ